MNRSIQQWRDCSPKAMAEEQSTAATMFAFQDAKADIDELYRQNEQMRGLLRVAAYPQRGTFEDKLDQLDIAALIQEQFTLAQLDPEYR